MTKPTALKLLEGNPGRRPLPQNEVKPDDRLPSAPAHLNKPAQTEWRRLCKELNRLGLLTVVDRAAFAAYCQAYGKWVLAERSLAQMAERDPLTHGVIIKTSNGNVVQNPLVGAARRASQDMVRYAAEFGMTPRARAGLETEAPDDDDDEEEERRPSAQGKRAYL